MMNPNINTQKPFRFDPKRHSKMRGISLVEIIIVLVIISILSAISIPYIFNYTKLYKPEDQALKVMDLMREANQLALTRRRTIRFEIDWTTREALIIDETGPLPAAADDQRQIKAIPLEAANLVRMDAIPTGVTRPNPPNYADAVFAADTTGHIRGATNVNGNNVWAARFRRDGTVVNAAGNPVTSTLYLWEPLTPGNAAPKNIKGVRAITIFGGTGAVRYWKHNGTTFLPTN